MGTVVLTATDLETGATVATSTVDLAPLSGIQVANRVSMNLGGFRRIRLTITAALDPGEVLVVDGVDLMD